MCFLSCFKKNIREKKFYGECSICLEEMSFNLTATPCAHLFHTSCLSEWQKKQNSCPNCGLKF